MTESVRLAKRLAEQLPCSRRQAEQYIEGGWVRVDGEVVETPQFRVQDQKVELDARARLDPVTPMTLLLHKPAGYDFSNGGKAALQLLVPGNRANTDRSGIRVLRRHLVDQVCVTPLETGASGLLVFTQDHSIRRKLVEDANLVENELIVEVRGEATPAVIHALSRSPVIDGRAMLAAKVSLNNQTNVTSGLRFAVKGSLPGQIAQMCEKARLTITAMKRIRVGRIPLAGLAPGQWRYLTPRERF